MIAVLNRPAPHVRGDSHRGDAARHRGGLTDSATDRGSEGVNRAPARIAVVDGRLATFVGAPISYCCMELTRGAERAGSVDRGPHSLRVPINPLHDVQ